MENHTNIEFRILQFSSSTNKLLLVCIFSTLYLIGIILNSVVITVICLYVHLHTPLYLFFCNLSVIDICSTTVFIPKLLYILISGNDLVSINQCFTQIFFIFMTGSAEMLVLFVMGYDRYTAICHPLHYHRILSMRNSTLILVILWVCAFINSSSFIILPFILTFDQVVNIHQFFCDVTYVYYASHGGSNEFYIVLYVQCAVFTLGPLFCNFVSYIRIFCVIERIKSSKARRKTLSTCSSHLIVMIVYYSSGVAHVISSFQQKKGLFLQVLAMFYSTIVPMINPLVYSLANSEMKKALQRCLKVK